MKSVLNICRHAALVGFVTVASAVPALAASGGSDWTKAPVEGAGGLADGLKTLAVPILTLVFMGLGIWVMMSNRFETHRFMNILIGATMIGAAGSFAAYYMGFFD